METLPLGRILGWFVRPEWGGVALKRRILCEPRRKRAEQKLTDTSVERPPTSVEGLLGRFGAAVMDVAGSQWTLIADDSSPADRYLSRWLPKGDKMHTTTSQ